MSTALLKLPTLELLALWSELEQCLHGTHGYGGDTAQIYAYRLNRDRPLLRGAVSDSSPLWEQETREAGGEAEEILHALLTLFSRQRECSIEVDGYALNSWRPRDGFIHRAHVKVTPNGGREDRRSDQ